RAARGWRPRRSASRRGAPLSPGRAAQLDRRARFGPRHLAGFLDCGARRAAARARQLRPSPGRAAGARPALARHRPLPRRRDVLVSVLFASMSGSAVADAAGPGMVTIRAMDKAGYPRGFAAAIVAASSVLGPIIPPSIPMILYALMANASIAALFLAGVIPGLIIAAAM